MIFVPGERSLNELKGVHSDLVAVVKRAIEITPQDFSVHDGIRTLEEQKNLVSSGASKTLNSRHITGHAVDLVPYINGKLRWEWEPIYQIAEAVRTAAEELQVQIRWGGAWDILLTSSDEPTEDIVSAYVERRRSEGKRAFIDGPHYELPKSIYPDTA
ncbi:MAG TPA: M15 family peptidase [Gammaproteobacteria bacterium]|nr:M15 family peptidase [Gammaproteobacteria bacterium]